jgi:protein SCO1/2
MILVLTLIGCTTPAPVPTATPSLPDGVRPIEPAKLIEDVALTDQNNKPFRIADHKGKAILFTFGYTHCPDVCPVNLANFKQIKLNLGADAKKVVFVFVTVDPKRDTPEVLAKHLPIFDTEFIGVGADATVLAPFLKTFGVTYSYSEAKPTGEYDVAHTASSFLVDVNGKLIRNYTYNTPFAIVADDVRKFLGS